jgi:beta-glucuronidase
MNIGFRRVEAVVGEHVWNFAEFTTTAIHAGRREQESVGTRRGVSFTCDRQPKAAAHVVRQRWARSLIRQPTAILRAT